MLSPVPVALIKPTPFRGCQSRERAGNAKPPRFPRVRRHGAPRRGRSRHSREGMWHRSSRNRQALAARERPVERRHGACLARILVTGPGAENRREKHGHALGADHARGARALIPAAVSIHCCERRHPIERHRQRRITARRPQQRADGEAMRRQCFEPAHGNVEQALASRLFVMSLASSARTAWSSLHVGGEDRQLRAEFAAQLRQ